MDERDSKSLNNLSSEDKEKMERLGNEAKNIIANAEAVPQEEVFKKSESLLTEEAQKDIELAEKAAMELFNNEGFINDLFSKLQKKYGWHESKFRAMLTVLRHALDEVYYRSRLIEGVDEYNPHPEGETRDTRNILFYVVATDYGAETAREVLPLIDYYVREMNSFIKKERGIV